jgi:hypothetical protein
MQVKVLAEFGHDLALMGMAYSYKDRALDPEEWWPGQREKAERRALILAHRDGGHNKFLESVQVWIDVEASRAWWSEADTYRVGTTKQSESTMHTLAKRPPRMSDFEAGTDPEIVSVFLRVWEQAKGDITALKMNLPEGFLQRRLVCTNYKTLRNILWQREGHRLKQWDVFREAVLAQVQRPNWIAAVA